MVRTTLTAVLVIALAAGASAFDIRSYDALYTGDTAYTLDAGAFSIQGSFLYLMADKSYDADGESQDWGDDNKATGTWFPVKISYGVMDNLEIGVTPMFVMNKLEYGGRTTEYEGNGLADTWIWAKYGFMPDPVVSARVGVKVATGEDEPDFDEIATGSGQMDIDGAVVFGLPSGPGSLDGSLGYRYRMDAEYDDGDYTPGNEINFCVGYTYFVSDAMDLRLAANGFFGSDPEVDGEPFEDPATPGEDRVGQKLVSINPGFDYIMDSGVSLGFDVFYPLMGTNIDAGWGLGLSVGWGN
jgi:hypothetical protein